MSLGREKLEKQVEELRRRAREHYEHRLEELKIKYQSLAKQLEERYNDIIRRFVDKLKA
ncbi:MAG: hypothetical protein QXO93_03235 [Acidilobaceae archaeon]